MPTRCPIARICLASLTLTLFACSTPATQASIAGPDVVSFFGGLDAGKTDAGKTDGTHADAGPEPDAALDSASLDVPAVIADSTADAVKPEVDVPPAAEIASGPVCGDGQCQLPETTKSCAADCPAGPAVCGDGWCQFEPPATESPPSCPIDCDAGAVAVLSCLKGTCSSQVSACLASKDCSDTLAAAMSCVAECGGGLANCDYCTNATKLDPKAYAVAQCGFKACGGVTPDGFCGDDQCGTKESSQTCPYDCQGGGPVCGDGACTPPENASQCPGDCKPANFCGDGQCQESESASSCPADCQGTGVMCGDAVCQASETVTKCPFDCDPAIQPSTACGKAKCGKQSDACFSDSACFQVLLDALACLKKCGGGSSCQASCAGPVLGNDLAYDLATCGQAECPQP